MSKKLPKFPVMKDGRFFGYADAAQIAAHPSLEVYDEAKAAAIEAQAAVDAEKRKAEKRKAEKAVAEAAGANPAAVRKGPGANPAANPGPTADAAANPGPTANAAAN